MRIFKNRGDIYFSKTNKEKSKEQKILFSALAFIICFTIVFVTFTCIKNDFSAKKFFAPENTTSVTIETDESELLDLPEVNSKNNFVTFVHKDNRLLFANITQVDMESKAYKSATLRADTQLDGKTMAEIFKQGGGANTKNALESYMGIELDFYIAMENTDFANFYDSMGGVNYPILNDIRYKNNDSHTGYSIKIKAGEQKINATRFIDLIRYYIEVENSTSQANELFLASLTQHLNSKNLADGEDLFRELVTHSDTNITIRDFNSAADELYVMCNDQTAMSVYSAEAKYNDNKINSSNLKKVKGYFAK